MAQRGSEPVRGRRGEGDGEPVRLGVAEHWATLATWLVLLGVGLWTGGVKLILQGLAQFFTGDVSGLLGDHHDDGQVLPDVIGAVALLAPVMFVSGALMIAVYGRRSSNLFQRRTREVPRNLSVPLALPVAEVGYEVTFPEPSSARTVSW
jgi:hypothetical protein